MKTSGQVIICALLLLLLGWGPLHAQRISETPVTNQYRHSVEISPMTPLFDIYVAQYSYQFTPQNKGIIGAAYVNIKHDGIGRFHAPTVPFGYRRYIWRKLHAEYQLWPAYNYFRSYEDGQIYAGFEVYSELRAGTQVDFRIGGIPLFANLQWVYGIGLYPGNKPDVYLDWAEEQPHFHFPHAFLGIRF